jgi:hypothetical protein
MTRFEEGRHYCRNPRCKMKMPHPVENDRSAFCCRGCYQQFYRTRCLICEEPIARQNESTRICGKRKCRAALQAGHGLGRYYVPRTRTKASKKPVNTAPAGAPADGRGIEWAIAVNRTRIRGPRYVLDGELPTP